MATSEEIKHTVSHSYHHAQRVSHQNMEQSGSPLHEVLDKLQQDPLSITTEDARRLNENYESSDTRSAKIISAVETLAEANQEIHKEMPTLGHGPLTSLLTIVNDLKAAVDANPAEVNNEILKMTQGIVSSKCPHITCTFPTFTRTWLTPQVEMQRILGQSNAPHPELEAELRKAFARIEPKVEHGTVTREEADHLHSLEARAHGYTEKGGLTAIAQSVVAKRERALSTTENTNVSRAEQSANDKAENLKMAELSIAPGLENEPQNITKEDAALVQSREHRAHGHVKKGSVAAEAQHFANTN
jgi:hypothetical protein